MREKSTDLMLNRRAAAADMMIKGLMQEYLAAMRDGRLDKWAAAMHATVDLLAVPIDQKGGSDA